MNEVKIQKVADLIDNDSTEHVDELIADQEMQSIWSRFHLIGDIIKGDVSENIAVDFDKTVSQAIANEPTVLVTTTNKPLAAANKPSFIGSAFGTKVKDWAEQATGFAIAASVTAVIIFGVQNMNSPQTTLQSGDLTQSAITSLELLEPENLDIGAQPSYTRLQEDLIDYTKVSSQYGLQTLTPFTTVVNHSVSGPLTIIKSNFDSILESSMPLDSTLETEQETKADEGTEQQE